MLAYILEVIIAGTASYYIYDWHWWAASLMFPIVMMIGNQATSGVMALSNQRRLLDGIIMLVQIGYIVSQVILFQKQFGHWYGWMIGIAAGWLLTGLMSPRRWRDEARFGM